MSEFFDEANPTIDLYQEGTKNSSSFMDEFGNLQDESAGPSEIEEYI